MQKDESITGHFLICYVSVLLERLVQVKVLGNRFCTEDVMGLARGFRVVEGYRDEGGRTKTRHVRSLGC